MRLRNAFCLLAAASLVSFITRHHVHELVGVLRIYATFYSYLTRHPEVVYRYQSPSHTKPFTRHNHDIIPAIIHQIILSDAQRFQLDKYKDAISSCRALHPTWKYKIWTDEEASDFIEQHYPNTWPHYASYKQTVQRANILRYALLDHFGGIYLDLDVTCLKPLDELRHLSWLTPGAHPAGLNNAFILSRAHHPFLKHLLAEVEKSDLSWGLPYVETMLTTGCMFLSTRWMEYVRSLSRPKVRIPEEDRLHVLGDENGKLGPHMLRGAVTTPLFRHGGSSSWHEWDAAAIVMIGRHYYYFISIVALGGLTALVLIGRFSKRRESRRLSPRFARLRRELLDKSSNEGLISV